MRYSDMQGNEYILRENKETKKLIAFKKLNLSESQKKGYKRKGYWKRFGYDSLELAEYYILEYLKDDSNKWVYLHLSKRRPSRLGTKLMWDSYYERLKVGK